MLGVIDARAREVGACGYVRYMDDILVFGSDKASLWQVQAKADIWIRERLDLVFKPAATRVLPVRVGVPFLGFVVFPGLVRLDPARVRRWRRKMALLQRRAEASPLQAQALVSSASSLLGWAGHADAGGLCRSWVRRRVPGLCGEGPGQLP